MQQQLYILLMDFMDSLAQHVRDTNALHAHLKALALDLSNADPHQQKLVFELQMTKVLLAESEDENEWWRAREHDRKTTDRPDKSGYVYLVRSLTNPGYYKIGRARNVQKRMRKFEVVMPFEIELEHSMFCEDYYEGERYWHRRFAEHRLEGEWFSLDTEQVEEFKSLASFHPSK